ncbi:glyoxalase [Aestuariicella hydrocarbonica]|uniref:Glyoxalase n=1 Tax=Pseudomaricurvus hydrocarbonicus TaxID=1470433 RepID=A0A9E5JYA5_9GAMM|nr:VOC family protein [Aestuariicella hydrocarbonica]NHO66881.1 glyoxalase [Aestuariicella hydrocarbonica]
MKIIGPDSLVFGVDDVASCNQYLTDYGLIPKEVSAEGGRFEALDGTNIEIRHKEDTSLPAPLPTGSTLRKTVYGVADEGVLEQIAAELGKDREVIRHADGSIEALDDMGFALGFQVTIRRPLSLPDEIVNAPGAKANRGINVIGADEDADIVPRTLSHVVYFVPDQKKAEAFYVERLGFRVADRFTNLGPFLRPQGTLDHHTLFLVHTPPEMQGVEHFTFHLGNPSELLQAGKRFVDKGYESFWGPGRHVYGSNWFWYFNSPMGVHVEYDADMDLHDDSWEPRAVESSADVSQIFNFTLAKKWMPGGDPH